MKATTRASFYKQICIVLALAVLGLGWYQLRQDTSPSPAPVEPKKILGYTGSQDTVATDPLKVPLEKALPVLSPTRTNEASTSAINAGASSTGSTPVVIANTGSILGESMGSGTLSLSGATPLSGGQVYFNEALGYGFTLPKKSWYAGTGPRDGAAHSVAVFTSSGGTTFEEAGVRVWYYPNTLLPELGSSEGGFYQDPRSNNTYLRLKNGTLKIEGDMESSVVNAIIQTANRR